MTRRLPLLVVLLVTWVALWGDLTVANVVSGLAVGGLILARYPLDGPAGASVRPLAALHFLGVFTVELVKASAVLAWEVVTPTNSINQGIVAVPVLGCSRGVVALVANAISLTPGTLTLEVDDDPVVLYVHVLHLRSVEDVRRDVLRFEALAIRAFGGSGAIALLARADHDSSARSSTEGPRPSAPEHREDGT